MRQEPGGLLTNARQCLSPNHDRRPDACPVDLLVIHNISLPPNQFGGNWIEDLFLNRLDPKADDYFPRICKMKVSTHLLIRRDGELVQYVPLDLRAWHAGNSIFKGRENCNDFSIGIELEGTDNYPYNPVQYRVLCSVCRSLIEEYENLNYDNIVGHSDIAPGRKTDPGPSFDWDLFRRLLRDS